MGLQDGLFLCLEMFRGDVLGYGWKQCFQEQVKEDVVIKLDLAQATTTPPLMDVVSDVGCSVLVER